MSSGFDNDTVFATNVDFRGVSPVVGQFTADGQLLIGSTAAPYARVALPTATGVGLDIVPGAGTLALNSYTTANFIVSSSADAGNYTTIAAAIAAASSGDTIFIKPGTYTENLTLKAGVNLTAYVCDSSQNATGHVIISGTCTLTTAGTVSISGIQLQTNGAALLAVTGSDASVVALSNCYLNCTDATGITLSSSSASSGIRIQTCVGNLGTTGIGLFDHSGAGTINFLDCDFGNSGGSSTASTVSGSGSFAARRSAFSNPITTSSTSAASATYCQFNTEAQNVTALTAGGSGTHLFYYCLFGSGTASAVSVGNTTSMWFCDVGSSNANAIAGAGTVKHIGQIFTGTSLKIGTTTQIGGLLQGGQTQAPSTGFIGEQVRSAVGSGAAVAVANNTPTDITSISLTAGIWDVSLLGEIACTGSFTQQAASISTTSATNGTAGDNEAFYSPPATTGQTTALCVPSYRLTLTSTTTVYYVGFAVFTTGAASAYGRISATRVG